VGEYGGELFEDGSGDALSGIDLVLARVARGDVGAGRASPLEVEVVELFDAYRDRLFRYVLSFGVSVDDSEDVVQEVFLALFRHLRGGGARSHLRGWLFRVAHNLALKRRMGNRRMEGGAELLLETVADEGLNPEEEMVFRERQAGLLAMVKAMPEVDERCLRLRAEGLKYREIAEVLGISLGGVSLALTRALGRLRHAEVRR
jgi:RNA polymerase sigma-70 factor (ECF subfamily)